MLFRHFSFVALISTCISSSATADLVNALVPDWAGEATATTRIWNSFSQAVDAPNFPDTPFATDMMLFNFEAGAMIAGSGNIYNQAGGLNLHIYGTGPVGAAVLNIATSGSQLNYGSTMLVLRGADPSDEQAFFATADIRFDEVVEGLGNNITVAYSFSSLDTEFEVAEWAFLFNGTNPHLSLDAASVAINSVPAPATIALLALGTVARRRRG